MTRDLLGADAPVELGWEAPAVFVGLAMVVDRRLRASLLVSETGDVKDSCTLPILEIEMPEGDRRRLEA